jgi:hypothetical protein
MSKAHPISVTLKLRIAKHKEKHDNISFVELAQLFNVSYDQARSAVMDYKSGKLNVKNVKKVKSNSSEIKDKYTTEELFDSQFHQALADLEAAEDMNVLERINALEKIAKIRKALQSVRLEAHLKRADADIIAAIIRRYDPDASDERIIEIYKEEVEKLRNE